MIQEDYVSFETAKLLKERGFDFCCEFQYINCSSGHPFLTAIRDDADCYYKNSEIVQDAYSAPTLQMAMKWLRDVHHLVIEIEFIDFLEHGEVWLYSIIERKTIKRLTGKDEDFTEHSYEEACEAAIKYCLENLVQKDNNPSI